MRKKLLVLGVAIFCSYFSAVAQTEKEDDVKQENVVSHKVEMGETVMLIAKKYRTTPENIYDLNPEAVHGISYNTVLQIPADKRYVAKDKAKKTNRINNDAVYNSVNQTAGGPKG